MLDSEPNGPAEESSADDRNEQAVTQPSPISDQQEEKKPTRRRKATTSAGGSTRKRAASRADDGGAADAGESAGGDAATGGTGEATGGDAATSGAPDPTGDTGPAGETSGQPAKKATRTRRKKAAPAAGDAPVEAAPPGSAESAGGGGPAGSAAGAEPPSDAAGGRSAAVVAPLFLAPEPAAGEAAGKETTGKGAGGEGAGGEGAGGEGAAAAETTGETSTGTRRRRSRRATAESEGESGRAADTPPASAAADTSGDPESSGSQDDTEDQAGGARPRRRGRRGRGRGKGAAEGAADSVEAADSAPTATAAADAEAAEPAGHATESDEADDGAEGDEAADGTVKRRRRRRRRKGSGDTDTDTDDDTTVVKVRDPDAGNEVRGVTGSTRLEAKRQRRRGGRDQRRTRPQVLSESEFLARREAVDRVMVIRESNGRTQIGVLEDGILVEHYVTRASGTSIAGSVYLGKVQNVLPSMEAAFVDVGKGRNAVLYAGEVNWDVTGLEGKSRSIEQALRSGDSVLVQVTKDPVGHKGARLTSHIALSGRHLVYVPRGNASGISRKLPDTERRRLRNALKDLVPEGAGVIVRTAAEGASEDELARDVKRLQAQWDDIQARAAQGNPPALLYSEPDLVVRVVRDLFNEDFRELVIQGDTSYETVEAYLAHVSPDLVSRLRRHTGAKDVFAEHRIDEQILKGLDRKVFLPSGGHLVIDRTEAMTVIDVNTGKYTGTGGNLEETVTRNNLEAAEEIVRQLRLRDLGGIIVIDFIDMVLESNRDLVLRRLTECLGRDRTKHQVTEITSLGLVQMTRKRVGAGLLEAFSETCECCKGRGVVINLDQAAEQPNTKDAAEKVKAMASSAPSGRRKRSSRSSGGRSAAADTEESELPPTPQDAGGATVDGTPADTATAASPAAATNSPATPPAAPQPADNSEVAAGDAPAAERLGDENLGVGGMLRRFRRAGGRRRSRP